MARILSLLLSLTLWGCGGSNVLGTVTETVVEDSNGSGSGSDVSGDSEWDGYSVEFSLDAQGRRPVGESIELGQNQSVSLFAIFKNPDGSFHSNISAFWMLESNIGDLDFSNNGQSITFTGTDTGSGVLTVFVNGASKSLTINIVDSGIATLNNLPLALSSLQETAIIVGGSDVVAYRYKLGPLLTTSCSDSGSYSSESDISNAIIETLAGDGIYKICVEAKDTSGKWQKLATEFSWQKDTQGPIITITSDKDPGPTDTYPTLTISFNEKIQGFHTSGFNLVNATLDGVPVVVSDKVYQIRIIPDSSVTSVSLSFSANEFNDLAGNGSQASSVWSIDYDNTRPSVVLSSPTPNGFITSVSLDVTYSGASSINLTPGDVLFSGNSTDCVAAVNNGTTSTPDIIVTGCSESNGFFQVQISPGTSNNGANPDVGSVLSEEIYFDVTPPSLPTDLSLGMVPNTLWKTPRLFFTPSTDTDTGVQKYEASVYLVSNDSQIVDWTQIARGGYLEPVPLSDAESYYMKIRAIDGSNNVSAEVTSPYWTTSIEEYDVFVAGTLYPAYYNYGFSGGMHGPYDTPIQYSSQYRYDEISLGDNSLCGFESGNFSCFGNYIGDGTNDFQGTPTDTSGSQTYTKVVGSNGISYGHRCAITSVGELYCWGEGSYGQLGNGSNTSVHSPSKVSGSHTFIDVDVGQRHTCAINSSNEAYCWGDGGDGRLGPGNSNETDFNTPQLVAGGMSFQKISVGARHSCALDLTGHVYCWGEGSDGQIGNGNILDVDSPTLVSGGYLFTEIESGLNTTCGLTSSSDMYCWGYGERGGLGNGSFTDSLVPSLVFGSHKFEKMALGHYHTCAIDDSDDLYCWGFGEAGQTGLGHVNNTNSPQLIYNEVPVIDVSALEDNTCLVNSEKELYCWGEILGSWSSSFAYRGFYPSPKKQPTSNPSFVSVSSSRAASACGLTESKDVYCWGSPEITGLSSYSYTPSLFVSAHQFRAISLGGSTYPVACGITETDDAYCWGDNQFGKMGDGTQNDSATPVAVSGGHKFRQLSIGVDHTCGVTTSNEVYCWGRNNFSQLGAHSGSSYVPIQINLSTPIQKVKVAGDTVCALSYNNQLFCWGRNYYGEIGNGDNTLSSVPLLAAGGQEFNDFVAMLANICGLTIDGRAYCWGSSSDGINGSFTTSYVPQLIGGSYSYQELYGNSSGVCGKEVSGDLYCWGQNDNYQLGLGFSNDTAAPLQILGEYLYQSVTHSNYGTYFLASATNSPPYIQDFDITDVSPLVGTTVNLTVSIDGTYDEYCLLENETNVNSCTFISGAVPSTTSVSAPAGFKTLTLFVRNSDGTSYGKSSKYIIVP